MHRRALPVQTGKEIVHSDKHCTEEALGEVLGDYHFDCRDIKHKKICCHEFPRRDGPPSTSESGHISVNDSSAKRKNEKLKQLRPLGPHIQNRRALQRPLALILRIASRDIAANAAHKSHYSSEDDDERIEAKQTHMLAKAPSCPPKRSSVKRSTA